MNLANGKHKQTKEVINQISKILDKIETPDSEGKYLPFCFVIQSILETLKSNSES